MSAGGSARGPGGEVARGPGKWWADCALPAIRHEAHFGDRVVRCFAQRARSFHELFAATVSAHASREALVCDGLRLTWGELDERVARVAGGLAARGIGRGDRVALFVSNRPEFVIALFAVQRLGAITVPIGAREQRDGLRWILGHCGARAIFHDAELAHRLPLPAELPQLAFRVACPPPESLPVEGPDAAEPGQPDSLPFAELAAGAPLREAAEVGEEDPAVILYTSGTTGRPKGAMLTHLNVVHSCLHFVSCMGLAPGDRSLLAVPASHVTGLIANIASFAAVGGALVVMPAFKAGAFLALAARERITHTLMVPAMYNLALLQPDFDRHDLSAWRIGGYGGAPMPVATIDALAARLPGLTLLNAYGATETTSPTTMIPAGLTRDHADSVGVALPCADVIVVDDDGRELPAGEVGELWISGPMVVRGYWNDEAATAREFTAGWWHSGDLGSVDADGFVRVFDRKKDMLNRGGYKIFSVEVENLIAAMPGVVEAAVVGRPCPVLGERVHAFVHATDPAVDAEAIRAFCAERLADYKVPETVTISVEPLPRNPNGKLLKRVLRERLGD
ncbi:AMP-binding protein [Burkholderiaceae bacterium FT117]|uniref:class I adenylate-forming enzyme family protein n=1 Tax=Zeimonas sediminis TaxID=2944268 RepID=UPI002342C047|nr:AMP-binding protein [Zeimonas sediminis]MCM5570024.1 AMP-binding protein [Zeimonas sediminis]